MAGLAEDWDYYLWYGLFLLECIHRRLNIRFSINNLTLITFQASLFR